MTKLNFDSIYHVEWPEHYGTIFCTLHITYMCTHIEFISRLNISFIFVFFRKTKTFHILLKIMIKAYGSVYEDDFFIIVMKWQPIQFEIKTNSFFFLPRIECWRSDLNVSYDVNTCISYLFHGYFTKKKKIVE